MTLLSLLSQTKLIFYCLQCFCANNFLNLEVNFVGESWEKGVMFDGVLSFGFNKLRRQW